MSDDKAVFIEVRFASGRIIRAEGDSARECWDWLQAASVMQAIHGGGYTGEPMKEVSEKEPKV